MKTPIRPFFHFVEGHQGSALSPLLFITVMDVLTEHLGDEEPWAMLFADDIVLAAETKKELQEKLENWRAALEDAGLRTSRTKTETLRMNTNDKEAVQLAGESLPDARNFTYLGSTVDTAADCEADVNSRIGKGWGKWSSLTGVLCDKKMSNRLKGKVYRTMVRPAIMYGSETWALKKDQERKLDVAEMRMLRWSLGKTRLDKIPNSTIRSQLGVRALSEKIKGARLRWFGHVERREDAYVGKLANSVTIEGKRSRGQQKRTFDRRIALDLKELKVPRELAMNRAQWRRVTFMADPSSSGTTSST